MKNLMILAMLLFSISAFTQSETFPSELTTEKTNENGYMPYEYEKPVFLSCDTRIEWQAKFLQGVEIVRSGETATITMDFSEATEGVKTVGFNGKYPIDFRIIKETDAGLHCGFFMILPSGSKDGKSQFYYRQWGDLFAIKR